MVLKVDDEDECALTEKLDRAIRRNAALVKGVDIVIKVRTLALSLAFYLTCVTLPVLNFL
jgi:hypothetical protein